MLAKLATAENEDTMWPCEELCDAIEEADSDDLDRGFQIGVLNSRGATWRSPLDGGDLERRERESIEDGLNFATSIGPEQPRRCASC